MARIPDEEIAWIKRETDLAALVPSRGVELELAARIGISHVAEAIQCRERPRVAV